MNSLNTTDSGVAPTAAKHLLDVITAVREKVGDGLNDDEFTWLLQKAELPIESGFAFLSYCGGFVTLSVPPQELANWYPEKGWVMAAKEQAAMTVAQKYGLSLYKPPDAKFPWHDSTNPHHHFELSNQSEIVIVIHPQYVKVRLFAAAGTSGSARITQMPLLLGPDLLKDLSTLYRV
jgi:hypothetical protein